MADRFEIIGIDHVYLAISDMERSERFYDAVMQALGFRKKRFEIGGESHVQYYNRHFGFVLRPARTAAPHDSYAPGLHHLCFRMVNEAAVKEAAARLKAGKISVSEPKYYPDYAPDYFAVYFSDPDGIRLEITNYREERRRRHDDWENS